MAGRIKLILASASPRRLHLLAQIGVEPDRIVPTAIDETPKRSELPRHTAVRLAKAKALAARETLTKEEAADTLILAADTVVAVGRRLLPKAESMDDADQCLGLLSGRGHRVYTAVALMTAGGKVRQRLVESRVRFKRLSQDEKQHYIASGEWRGKAGAYGIQGIAESFVVRLIGSYSNVVGLPLAETATLLEGEGYQFRRNWIAGRSAN